MKRYSPCHVQPPPPLLSLLLFQFLPFRFNTQKGEDGLSCSTEGSPSHSLQCSNKSRINTEHKADPIGFLPVLIDSPMPRIQTLVQPAEPLKITLQILHSAQKLGHHSFIGGERIQAHHLEPGTLPGHQGGYPSSQPVSSLLVLTDNNGCPFGPVGINKAEGELLFRGLIHKPADSTLDVCKVVSGDLNPWVALAHSCHPNALPSGPGVTQLPNLLGPI